MTVYQPVGNYVLIERDLDSEVLEKEKEFKKESENLYKHKSGLYIAEVSKEKSSVKELEEDMMIKKESVYVGTVKAIGKKAYKDCFDGEAWVSIGDKVLYKRYAGTKIPGNDKLLIVQDLDIFAIVKD